MNDLSRVFVRKLPVLEVCLSWQVVQINSLELELHSVLSEHTEALFLQRRQRIKETANRLQQLSCKNPLCPFVIIQCLGK